jgi:hypothetical protein
MAGLSPSSELFVINWELFSVFLLLGGRCLSYSGTTLTRNPAAAPKSGSTACEHFVHATKDTSSPGAKTLQAPSSTRWPFKKIPFKEDFTLFDELDFNK